MLAPEGDNLALMLPGIRNRYQPALFPVSDTLIDHAAAQSKSVVADGIVLRLARSPAFKVTERELSGVVTYVDAGQPRAFNLTIETDPMLVTAATTALVVPAPSTCRRPTVTSPVDRAGFCVRRRAHP